MESHQIHRRKSSQSDDENTIIMNSPPESTKLSGPSSPPPQPPPPRSRVNSTPAQPLLPKSPSLPSQPPSAGPYRSSFTQNGHSRAPPLFRSSISNPNSLSLNGHSRTRSISTPYSPPLPSPLSFSFPAADNEAQSTTNLPPQSPSSSGLAPESSPSNQPQKHTRRHSRLHSRNLSIFFPRPGSLPQNTISEDGVQELELRPPDLEAPISTIPPAGSSVAFPARRSASLHGPGPATPLGAGFTFGGRRPPAVSVPSMSSTLPIPASTPTPPLMSAGPSSASGSKRRGHHHKHSMSHNFFSFLEPGSTGGGGDGDGESERELHTQPTPVPVSPWNPISPFPSSTTNSEKGMGTELGPPSAPANISTFRTTTTTTTTANGNGHGHLDAMSNYSSDSDATRVGSSPQMGVGRARSLAPAWTFLQFILGAWMWVSGQQIGSLACTGVGYWVVFDAFGVGVGWVVPRWLESGGGGGKGKNRRAYGNARIETVLMFAQVVYLMFASVYVCKETVEHVLLSSGGGTGGGGDGHHHHRGDEEPDFGVEFPILLTMLSFVSVGVSAAVFGNHAKLVEITGNRIPTLPALIRTLTQRQRPSLGTGTGTRVGVGMETNKQPKSLAGALMTNPYVASPAVFCVAILFAGLGVAGSQHTSFDLALAALITIVTFNVAYSACVVLGTVLLQTAPRRGLPGGRMEAFLRVMREVERHPQVLHLPAPHIWQLTPTSSSSSGTFSDVYAAAYRNGPAVVSVGGSLVVTLELHVKPDLGDEDVLKLTKWAWERCVGALGGRSRMGIGEEKGSGGGEVDVTIGVVRG